MKTDFTATPSVREAQAGDGHLIAFRLSRPACGRRDFILHRLLEYAFRAEGVLRESIVGDAFGITFGIADVADCAAGLRVLRDEFQTVFLLHEAEIAWFDLREEIWRRVHPGPGVYLLADFPIPRDVLDAVKKRVAESCRAVSAANVERIKRDRSDCGLP